MWSMNNTTPCARGVTAGRIWTRSFQSDLKMLQAKIFGQISSNFDCVIVTIATNTQTHLNTVYIFYISRDRDESFRRKGKKMDKRKREKEMERWSLNRFVSIYPHCECSWKSLRIFYYYLLWGGFVSGLHSKSGK